MRYQLWFDNGSNPDVQRGWYWKKMDAGLSVTDPEGPYETPTQAAISMMAYMNNMEVNCG